MNTNKNFLKIHEDLVDSVSLRINVETKEILNLCKAFYGHESLVSCIREAVINYSLKLKRDVRITIKKFNIMIADLKVQRETPFGEIQDKYKRLMEQKSIYESLLNRIEFLHMSFKHVPTNDNMEDIIKCLKTLNNNPMIEN